MVEKLLETAMLDSEKLSLQFEEINLVTFLERITTEKAMASEEKKISFTTSEKEIHQHVDVFHFENAINNIIDNAVKYGGEEIYVVIEIQGNQVEISISDTGTSLSEVHKSEIFQKFYRVPKGNTHDVKGYGIGLYYVKKIIEKHNGTVDLILGNLTKFKISLPHGG
jgi:two-component system phosphate regulon sensor histidine kinase PhoR